jgi:NAD(P)-dependent dehydrogenase (short-subunit alcohol dehydrogenase family)
LREKLTASRSRIVVVSSGAIRGVQDPNTLDDIVKAESGTEWHSLYSATKFTQLLGAHWWRRQLQGQCDVVAVSPG